MNNKEILGIDIGGTGIKGAIVDVEKGTLVTERIRIATPKPATPEAVAATVQQLIDRLEYDGPVGVGFPAIVRRGVAESAANIEDSWIGTSIEKLLEKKTGLPFFAVNDADAAGIAAMAFGAGQQYTEDGVVVMVTIGTGLGGALFVDGELMPNLEIGQIYLKNQKVVAEKYISNKVRKDTDMKWSEFGKRFNKFLSHVDAVLNPDLIVLGGGASKSFAEFKKHLKTNAEVKAATLANAAGTVGAAVYAARKNR
jgi:polyphosphate glucokinase